MGVRGPIPKPADRRLGHRSAAELAGVTKSRAGKRAAVPDPVEGWHPMAAAWFASLADSGQAAYYEASDWQMAVVAGEVLSRLLATPQRISSQLLGSWLSLASSLLVTEGDRRRMRIELVRHARDDDEESAAATLAAIHSRLSLADRKRRLTQGEPP